MILRNLRVPERGQVLEISCGTGWPTVEILRRMGDGARLIAIDASSAMLDVARKKIQALGPLGKKGVFFRTESPLPRLSFANDVYDLVVCNLGLDEMPSIESALADFARVTKMGGEVRCSLPLAGSFQEFFDIYREVLTKHDKHEALERLDAHIAKYPTADDLHAAMKDASLQGSVDIDEFSLLFKSSREFFFAPVVEYGPLPAWKEIAGGGQELQDVFWYIKEAIDAYFGGRAFSVTVIAGCLMGKKVDPAELEEAEGLATGRVERVERPYDADELPPPPRMVASGSVRTAELEIVEIEELSGPEVDVGIDGLVDVPLDAFVEGKERPPHLDPSPKLDWDDEP
jgi:ubiquinone/menaquinone biosynthesis C-methylase UbiE